MAELTILNSALYVFLESFYFFCYHILLFLFTLLVQKVS